MRINFLVLASCILGIAACAGGAKKVDPTLPSSVSASTVQVTKEVVIPTVASTPVKTEVSKDEMTCERSKEKRTMRIEKLEPKGCKLWYSHYGTKDPVASSQIANTHCEKVKAIIQGRLEAAGFKCTGEVTATPVATSKVTPVTTPTPTPTPTPTVVPKATPDSTPKATPTPSASPVKK